MKSPAQSDGDSMKQFVSTTRFASNVGVAIVCGIAGIAAVLAPESGAAADPPRVDEDGTIHVPAFALPESSLLNEGTHAALKNARDHQQEGAAAEKACPSMEGADRAQMPAIRKC